MAAAPTDRRTDTTDERTGTRTRVCCALEDLEASGVPRTFHRGTKPEGRPKAESRGGVAGEGQQPSHQLAGLGSAVSSPNGCEGLSPDRPKVFHYFQPS